MPLVRYRTLEQAELDRQTYAAGGENLIRLAAMLRFAYRFVSKRRFPQGVFLYRSLAEAQADQERWIAGSPPPPNPSA
jgi:hypothetical protein